ncbi:MAG: GNAT family N-acetyltransferase [Rectinemataceae bacterium]
MTGWRYAVSTDLPGFTAFLGKAERHCVALAEHSLRPSFLAAPVVETRTAAGLRTAVEPRTAGAKGILFLHESEDRDTDGAMLVRGQGSIYLLLPDSGASDDGLPALLDGVDGGARRIHQISGKAGDVERFECASAGERLETREYLLMFRPAGTPSGMAVPFDTSVPSGTSLALPPTPQGFLIRKAERRDFRALSRLQEEYEAEEVYGSLHTDPSGAAIRVRRLLGRQEIVIALCGGKPAGKANTNARGLRCDQLGGIFVRPEFRNAGLGTAMVGALVAGLSAQGRDIALYVRSGNKSAIAVYEKAGFAVIDGYRSDEWRHA